MDWFLFAQNDWDVYHDHTRIATYVQKSKITAEQYQLITELAYE